MRKMYFARSLGASLCQTLSYAFRASPTARSTSSASASAISDSVSSVAGLIVSNHFFECGSTNFPPMNRLYFGATLMWSVDSSEGAYSHRPVELAGPGVRRSLVSMAVIDSKRQMQNSKCKMQNAKLVLSILHFAFCILHLVFNQWCSNPPIDTPRSFLS